MLTNRRKFFIAIAAVFTTLATGVTAEAGLLACFRRRFSKCKTTCKASGSTRWQLRHFTANENGAGTNARVYVYIKLIDGAVLRSRIDTPEYNDRIPGEVNEYDFSGPDGIVSEIGFLIHSTVNGTDEWEWKCGWVELTNLSTGWTYYIREFGWINQLDTIKYMRLR